ncbi:hypothetical protein Afil01_62100 [Actinorhabdospora filicis]|uniref:Scaffolding protein n=1 Tax=Actinorhabdospora filicis TaxID=1785913 RepID=A0A9W6SSS3_9ACTN|nr:hypothetical protein [Actinorhabdospora filicis]GLZ81403.1 hypothetical protein Afil01_62100 [Actinorhabdospora filicis]
MGEGHQGPRRNGGRGRLAALHQRIPRPGGAHRPGDTLTDEATPSTDIPADASAPEALAPEPETEEIPAAVLRDRLTRANAEAAGFRVRLRELEEKLSGLDDPAEIRTALDAERAKTAALELDLARAELAAQYGLPAPVAAALNGSDRDALEAAAKTVAAHIAAAAPAALSGGLDPSTPGDDGPGDPRELARLYGPRLR